jgi:hypothetical protein
MSKVYLIKPLHKKSIVYHVEMYRRNPDGSISWFNLDETYRWGQGFIEEDLDCNLPWKDDLVAYARADIGWGCEFDDSTSIEWEFSDDISPLEQQEIKECYYEGGASWIYDAEHDWMEEDTAVHIIAPYQVSLCDELTGAVIKENVKLKTRPKPSNAWPFSHKDSNQGG